MGTSFKSEYFSSGFLQVSCNLLVAIRKENSNEYPVKSGSFLFFSLTGSENLHVPNSW